MHEGKRWLTGRDSRIPSRDDLAQRMLVDEFAIARGATEPITVKQTAEKVWEPKFLSCR
jgi:hypothetical protein